jgi:hypothetical protein
MSRDRTVAVVACVTGAGLSLFAASRTWVEVTVVRPAPLPALHEARTGTMLLPWLPALALVALAGAGALLATRGPVRAAVGVLLMLSGCGLVAGAVARAAPGWPLVAALGGLLIAGAGAVALARGRSWPGMGTRYDRPARASRPESAVELWDALDRGDDPTR